MVEVKGKEVGTRTRRVGLSDGLIFDGHRLRTAKQMRICDRLMRLLMRPHVLLGAIGRARLVSHP